MNIVGKICSGISDAFLPSFKMRGILLVFHENLPLQRVGIIGVRLLVVVLLVILLVSLNPYPSQAAVWDYSISTTDTQGAVDVAATTAVVDTANREIKLPLKPAPDLVGFWESGEMDYVVLTTTGVKHYSFDGTQMRENTILNVSGLTNPMALAAGGTYPDVLVADQSGLKHYSFTGQDMVHNPYLSVVGLTGVMAMGTAGQEAAALVDTQIQHYSFSGSSMVRNTVLEPLVNLTNPIDVALASGGYDTVVMEPNRVRWFSFTGSGMAENPALAVTGLINPVAFAIAKPQGGYDVAVVDGTQVKHYSFDGAVLRYNSVMSVTSGLTNPRTVAIRPGSYDRIIVDGNHLKYYQWNGTSLEYNANLSVTVNDLVQGAGFRHQAVVTSNAFNPGYNVTHIRVRAAHELPNNTMVTWSVTANGDWFKRWRVRGTVSGTVLEVSPDNGNTWSSAGTSNDALPSVNSGQLWAQVTPGSAIRWKAELSTTDNNVTPKVATSPRGGVAVMMDTSSAPNPPALPDYGACFLTTTPTLTWTFTDPDPGDSQSAYHVQVVRASDMVLVLDSGKVVSGSGEYTVPTSNAPDVSGPLWASGTYQFKYRVKVWDQADLESSWSNWGDFCVNALERPRIALINTPPVGQVSPNPTIPSTHIVITPGMLVNQLPKAKAGASVTVLIDSIGPINTISWTFPYTGPQDSSINTPVRLPDGVLNNPLYALGSATNRWSIEFWTSPNLAVCPSGTVVQMTVSGSGAAGVAQLNAPPYADGVVVTLGSVYEDWFVVLQGRD